MFALRNLVRNKIRSLLTISGVAIGIAIFTSLISYSSAFQKQLTSLIATHQVDIIIRSKGSSSALSSRISQQDISRIRDLSGVQSLSPLVLGAIKIPQDSYFLIFGTTSADYIQNKLGLVKGSLEMPQNQEILVGTSAAKKLSLDVQSKILFNDKKLYTVQGIFSSGSSLVDNGAVLSLPKAKHLLKREDRVNLALLDLHDDQDTAAWLQGFSAGFPELSAYPAGAYVSQIKAVQVLDTFCKGVSTISLLTCIVLIMNTMLMAVSERTKELGILMAIGWSRGRIVWSLTAEALLTCLIGAFLGNLLGWLILTVFHFSGVTGLSWAPNLLQVQIILQTLLLAGTLAFTSSIYPAYVAWKLSPAQALRFE